jgi:cytochrome c
VAAGVFLVMAGCRPVPVETARVAVLEVESINRGAELAATNCSRCHGIGANGASEHPSAPGFGEVAERYPLEFLQWTLEGGPEAGHVGMPAIMLDRQAIDDLKAYLRSLAPAAGSGAA